VNVFPGWLGLAARPEASPYQTIRVASPRGLFWGGVAASVSGNSRFKEFHHGAHESLGIKADSSFRVIRVLRGSTSGPKPRERGPSQPARDRPAAPTRPISAFRTFHLANVGIIPWGAAFSFVTRPEVAAPIH